MLPLVFTNGHDELGAGRKAGIVGFYYASKQTSLTGLLAGLPAASLFIYWLPMLHMIILCCSEQCVILHGFVSCPENLANMYNVVG
jgi:hypothetical protein